MSKCLNVLFREQRRGQAPLPYQCVEASPRPSPKGKGEEKLWGC